MKLKLASIDAEIEKAKMASGVEKPKLEARVMAGNEMLEADEKMETVSRVARVPDKLEGNLFQMLMGNPQNGTQKMVLEVTANPARNQAESAADPELQMDSVHADWCQEDQEVRDEFLKERKETAELADPKAIKMVPVQCQAVPEVEAVSCLTPTAMAVQRNAPGGAVPADRKMIPVREKAGGYSASQRSSCS
uniref:Uncharacterized protein n=1 Tax=Sphaerodactylus townsendi TaxID=933632 RepID=A0ACB8FNF3_9SAUR